MPGAYPCNASIITRDEQASHSSRLGWLYCNRTATGLVHASTQRTQDWLWHTEKALNKAISGHTGTG